MAGLKLMIITQRDAVKRLTPLHMGSRDLPSSSLQASSHIGELRLCQKIRKYGNLHESFAKDLTLIIALPKDGAIFSLRTGLSLCSPNTEIFTFRTGLPPSRLDGAIFFSSPLLPQTILRKKAPSLPH